MNTSSSFASDSLLREASSLRGFVEAHYDRLRDGHPIDSPDVRCVLVQRDRNAVYRLSCTQRWYVKLPTKANADMIRRELLGSRQVRLALSGLDTYAHPMVVSGSSDPPYILTSGVPGARLSFELYLACLLPFSRHARRLQTTFMNVGAALARLHASSPSDRIATNRPLIGHQPRRSAEAIDDGSSTQNMAGAASADLEGTFIHGNFQMSNILTRDARVTFLDFENCGIGSKYDDLSFVASQLLLTRAALRFPTRKPLAGLSAMLSSYAAVRPYNSAVLAHRIVMRFEQLKDQSDRKGGSAIRAAGLSVSTSTLNVMISKLQSGHLRLDETIQVWR